MDLGQLGRVAQHTLTCLLSTTCNHRMWLARDAPARERRKFYCDYRSFTVMMPDADLAMLSFGVVAICAACALLVIVGLDHPRLLSFAAMTTMFMPVFNPAIVHLPGNLRVATLLLVAILWGSQRKPLIRYRGKLFQATLLCAAIGLPLAFLGTRVTTSIADAILLPVAAVTMWVFVSQIGPTGLRQTLFAFCGTTVVASTGLALAHFGGAIQSDDRWLGLFVNPNSLGLVAAIAVVTGRRWRSPVYLIVLACSALCILQSGSRGRPWPWSLVLPYSLFAVGAKSEE